MANVGAFPYHIIDCEGGNCDICPAVARDREGAEGLVAAHGPGRQRHVDYWVIEEVPSYD